jgi:hypothetical protein
MMFKALTSERSARGDHRQKGPTGPENEKKKIHLGWPFLAFLQISAML